MSALASRIEQPNDLEAFWLPFTPNRAFKKRPRMIARSKDMHYYTPEGRPILDACAALWCCNAGHNRQPIVEAIQRQAAELDFSPAFQFAHPQAFALAARLAALAPADLEHVFFANSGSEAADTALKIALAYHNVRGHGSRQRLIGRERAYHGVGFGGISVGGMVNNRKFFGSLLAGVDHLPATYNREQQAFTKGEPDWGGHLADDLERIVALHDASTIAAVIVEPMAGSTGVLPAPKGYLQKLRAICDKHGILLIFDEVITGFGRLGAAFAAERYGVVPDIITFAKGVTSGYAPLGGVLASERLAAPFLERGASFAHGITFAGHPVSCAVALANLDVMEDERICENVRANEGELRARLESLRDLDIVGDVRGDGYFVAIELVKDAGDPSARFTVEERQQLVRTSLAPRLLDAGLICRADDRVDPVVQLAPVLTCGTDELAEIESILRTVLTEVQKERHP